MAALGEQTGNPESVPGIDSGLAGDSPLAFGARDAVGEPRQDAPHSVSDHECIRMAGAHLGTADHRNRHGEPTLREAKRRRDTEFLMSESGGRHWPIVALLFRSAATISGGANPLQEYGRTPMTVPTYWMHFAVKMESEAV
jgi:hypothetical protein